MPKDSNVIVVRWLGHYELAYRDSAIRDALRKTQTMDVLYRTPVCFNTATKEMFVGY